MRRTLSKADRICRRRDFTRMFRRGHSASDARIRLYVLPAGTDRRRVGVAVSRRHGTAVRRNRLKRLCREAFRTAREDLPEGYDYLVVPALEGEPTVDGIRQSLRRLARRLVREAPA